MIGNHAISLISVSIRQITERAFGDRYSSRCWYIKKQKFLHKVYQSEDKAVVSIVKFITRPQRGIVILTIWAQCQFVWVFDSLCYSNVKYRNS
jgi:hypothetical protein